MKTPVKQGAAMRHGFTFYSLQEYLEVPLRRPLLVVVPLVLVLAAAVSASVVLPKKYRSSTLILVESEKVPETFVAKMATESMDRRLKTMSQEVLSRTRLEQVIATENPYASPDGTAGSIPGQVERMRSSITIENKGSDAFVISFVHTRPDKAASVANRLAALFINEAESERERQAVEGFEFITSQLAETRRGLEAKEEAVRRFKEQNLGNLPEQLNTNLSTLQRLQLQEQSLVESMRATQTRIDLLRSGTAAGLAAAARPGAPASSLEQMRAQLADLRTRYTDQHPDVQSLQRRIRELEAGLPASSPAEPAGASNNSELRRAELELETLRAKRAEIDVEARRIQARVESLPRTEQQLATMNRDHGQLQDSYLSLLKKQMDARMAEQMERRWKGDRFKVLDPAHAPDRHFFPNRPLFAFAGLVAGLGLGLSLAFAAEFLDHSVKSAEDVEECLPYPLLASIPRIDPSRSGAWSR